MLDSSSSNNFSSGNVGSYAISTIDFNSWAKGPSVQVTQKTRKSKTVKEIIHKCFVEYSEAIADPFWIDKFNNASYGKFPKYFSYHDGILSFRKGAKTQILEVPGNPYEAAYACMEFFRTHGGLFSPTDAQQSLNSQYARSQACVNQVELTWGTSNKKIQQCLISNYVTGMKNIMNLTEKEMEQLRQTILLGLSNKYFGKHNITLVSNQIHTIEGLLWNTENRSFYINPNIKPLTTRTYTRNKNGPPAIDPSEKDMVPQFNSKWCKYLDTLDKKIARTNRRNKRVTVTHAAINRMNIMTDSTSTVTDATDMSDTTSTTDNDMIDD